MSLNAEKMTLSGEFVDLRPLCISDADLTFKWRQSPRSLLLNRGANSAWQQGEWIAARPANEFNFIIQLKDGKPIGMVSLTDIDMINLRGEPGRFLIGDEDATKGIPAAAEAMLLLYQLAFDHLGLHRVYGAVAEDNRRMIKWQLYMGMTKEGRFQDHYFINGRFQCAVLFGLIEPEFHKVAAPRLKAMIAAGHMKIAAPT